MRRNPTDLEGLLARLQREVAVLKRQNGGAALRAATDRLEEVREQAQATPSAPVELVTQTTLYTDDNGNNKGRVFIEFQPVTKAVDGSDISISAYEMWWRPLPVQGPHYRRGDRSVTNAVESEGFDEGSTYEFIIRAIGSKGQVGEFTDPLELTIAQDQDPPPVPTTPNVRQNLGTLVVEWDGLFSSGTAGPPADYLHTRIEWSLGDDTWTDTGIRAQGAIAQPFSQFDYDQTVFFRLVAEDRSGNESVPSGVASGIPRRLVDADLIDTSLDEVQQEVNQASNWIDTTGAELNTGLSTLDSQMSTLNNETIPDLQNTVGTLQTDLDTAEGRIDTVQNTTIPDLNTRLNEAQTWINDTGAELDTNLTNLQGEMDVLENTTIPDLQNQVGTVLPADIQEAQDAATAADQRAEEAMEAAEKALSGQTNLMANGMVQPVVSLGGGVVRWAAYQEAEEVTVYKNGTPVERDGSGPIFSLSTDPGDVLTADGPVAVWSDTLRSSLPPLSWAARELVIGVPANAAPYQFFVYAPFSAADVTATQGDDPEAAETFKVQAGTTTVLSGKGSGKWQFVSDERILVGWRGYGGNRSDVARPPHRYNLVYRGGNQMRVATTPDATATATQATGDEYGTNAVLLDWGEGNKGSVYPSADGSGNDMETGATPDTISDFYGLPHAISDYALMAVEPTIVRVEGWNGEEWVLYNEHDFSAASYEAPMGTQVGGSGGGGSNFTVEGPDGTDVEPSYWRLRGTGKFYARTNRGTREYAPVGFNATTYVPGKDPTGAAALRQAVEAMQAAEAAAERLDIVEGDVSTLQTSLDEAQGRLDTLQNTTLPGLDTRLDDVEYDTRNFAAEWITTGTLDTARLNAQSVAAAVGTFIEITAAQIVAGEIDASQINAESVAAAVAQFLEITTDQLVAGTAVISEGVVDKLWADVIRARKITSDMLVIGGTRLIDNPIFEPDESGTWGPGWLHPSEDPTARGTAEFYKPDDLDANAVRFMSDGEDGMLINMPNTRRAAVTPGQEVRVAADVKVPDGPGIIFGINFRDRDGNLTNSGVGITVPSTGNVWERFEASFVVPDDGSVTMEFVIAAILATGSATVAISNVDMRPKTGPELIVDGAIAARHVNANSVAAAIADVIELNAERITSGEINTARLNAQEVAAAVGEFLTISTDQLTAGSAAIGTALIEKLWTEVVRSRKITADMLVVGGATDLLSNANLERGTPNTIGGDIDGWRKVTGEIEYFYASSPQHNAIRLTAPGPAQVQNQLRSAVAPGDQFMASAQVYNGCDGPVDVRANWHDANGDFLSLDTLFTIPANSANWNGYEGTVTAPAGATSVALDIRLQDAATTGDARIADIVFRQQIDTALVVDGAISATKISASSELTAKVAQFLTVTADMIEANSITANEVDVGSLSGAIITADAFVGKEFTGGTFTGTTFRTGTTGQRVSIDPTNGLRAWDDGGVQTVQIGAGENRITGRVYTNTPGTAGIILDPITATGLPGIFFSEDGSTSPGQPAIYTDESWRLTIRTKRDSTGARGAVRIQGGMYMWDSAIAGGTSGDESSYRYLISPTGVAEFAEIWAWSGGENFRVANGAVGSSMIYNRTGSASANMIIGSAGWIGRSTSASKYKIDIQDAPVEWHERILALNPRTWIDKPNAERYAEYLEHKDDPDFDDEEALRAIEPIDQRVPGLVAEEVEAAGLTSYVTYGEDGVTPEGLAYDRLWTLLIPLVREQRDRIVELEGRIIALEETP